MEMVHKVTLTTGKVVYLSEMTQGKEEAALKAADMKGGGSESIVSYHMTGELAKILIAGTDKDGEQKKLTATEVELFYKDLSYGEVTQLRKAVNKVMGNVGNTEPVVESVIGGAQ